MNKILITLLLTSCGFTSQGNELSGQVKKVTHRTPIFCSDRHDVHVSLGVMRNGVGSISNEDVDLILESEADVIRAKAAAESGQLVKIEYDVERIRICGPDHIATRVTVLAEGSK